MSTRTVHDPFLGKDVEISSNLLDRLRGKYASGPTMKDGEPEFGWRQMPQIPIQMEAADEIQRLRRVMVLAAEIIDRNLMHQREKVADASSLLKQALAKQEG